jgi:hypothetical protein
VLSPSKLASSKGALPPRGDYGTSGKGTRRGSARDSSAGIGVGFADDAGSNAGGDTGRDSNVSSNYSDYDDEYADEDDDYDDHDLEEIIEGEVILSSPEKRGGEASMLLSGIDVNLCIYPSFSYQRR